MHLMMQHLFDLILVLLVLPILRSGGQSSHVHQLANIYGGEGGGVEVDAGDFFQNRFAIIRT